MSILYKCHHWVFNIRFQKATKRDAKTAWGRLTLSRPPSFNEETASRQGGKGTERKGREGVKWRGRKNKWSEKEGRKYISP